MVASVKTRPLIGLPGRRRKVSELAGTAEAMGDVDLDIYFSGYARCVLTAGGLPIHLPIDANPTEFIPHLDGLILTGGADIEPGRYGAEPDGNGDYEPSRDDYEIALLGAALAQDLPVLGICRGSQLLNVYAGGTLHQHVPTHARYDVEPHVRVHRVLVQPGTLLSEIYGQDWLEVNSLHHQAVDQIGPSTIISGWADDGTVEAIEIEGHLAVGIQWHPEMHNQHDMIFDWLIKKSSEPAAAKTAD
ncbi:MAG: gamma-glutamyl-gamma-aminobutyrate hydrolase family protein [Acidimicrobiia bacterium]|nr:gamma-glutamyl-gamma-aminobutyrate hydrolase family protein [Acidimicrobiia bacterium]